MMGIFDNFTGGKSRRDHAWGAKQYRDQVNAYADRGRNALAGGLQGAKSHYEPYADLGRSGLEGYKLYGDAVGAHGDDARAGAFETFDSDPFRDYADENTANALRDNFRRYNAAGMADSGSNRLATGRIAGEFARRDVDDWMRRLQGYGGDASRIGYGAAGQMAGLDDAYGTRLADLETNTGNALAHSFQNQGNFNAQTRGLGLSNLMRIGSLGVNALSAYNKVPSRVR